LVLPAISVLVTGSVWVHGAWYLFALPVAAVAISGNWRTAARFGCAVGVGILAGAMLTLHPLDHLFYQAQHLYRAIFSDMALQNPVGEFGPNPVGVPIVLFGPFSSCFAFSIAMGGGLSLRGRLKSRNDEGRDDL